MATLEVLRLLAQSLTSVPIRFFSLFQTLFGTESALLGVPGGLVLFAALGSPKDWLIVAGGIGTFGVLLILYLRQRFAEQQRVESRRLEEACQLLAERSNRLDVLERLLQVIQQETGAEELQILEYSRRSGALTLRESLPPGREVWLQDAVRRCAQGQGVLVFAAGDPLGVEDSARLGRLGIRTGVVLPLGPAGARNGFLLAGRTRPVPFAPDELRRLGVLAALAGAGLERLRLFEESQTRADDLVMLNEVGRILVETIDLDRSLNQIAELLLRQTGAAGAVFFLKDRQSEQLRAAGAAGPVAALFRAQPLSLDLPHLAAEAFRAGTQLIAENLCARPGAPDWICSRLEGIAAAAAIPMQAARGPVGVVCLYAGQAGAIPNRMLQRLRSIARLAASVVERGALDQALKSSEARLQEILDGLPALVIGIDRSFAILSINATAETISGQQRDRAMGQNFLGLLIRQDRERRKLETAFAAALGSGGHSDPVLAPLTDRAGQLHQIRWSTEALRDSNGVLLGLVVMGLDYTAQMKLEAQLLQAQKMESVGTLAGGMAHDFNNLLAGILGQAHLARSKVPEHAAVLGPLQKIEAAAQRGADLTRTLLTFARRSVLQPKPVNLPKLLEETVGLLSGSLSPEIQIVREVGLDLPVVQGDATQLQQVLLNLCVNARDAMPAGGTLGLRLQRDQRGGVSVEVSDDGIGMTEEVKAKLFEPFFTTKEPGKGTGLGLSVVFGIVRSHGGSIEVESAPGQGTRFRIHLPSGRRPLEFPRTTSVSVRAPISASASALRDAVPYGGSESILVVDDDQMLRETNAELLGRLGYRIHSAADGVAALNLLDQKGLRPQLVLLDVIMPGLAGVPLFWELRKRLPEVPVLLISGYSQEAAVQQMLDAGALELIEKPFRIDDLAAAIRRALVKV